MKHLPTFLLIAALCLLLHGIVVEAGAWGNRPLVYGHELRDGQRIRFLAQRFDMDLGISLKLPNHGLVWFKAEDPNTIYVLAHDAMIESDPACGNVVRLRLTQKGKNR